MLRLMSCAEASRLLSQMQDGRVPLGNRVRLRVHLLWCEACRRFAVQLHFLRAAMRRYAEDLR